MPASGRHSSAMRRAIRRGVVRYHTVNIRPPRYVSAPRVTALRTLCLGFIERNLLYLRRPCASEGGGVCHRSGGKLPITLVPGPITTRTRPPSPPAGYGGACRSRPRRRRRSTPAWCPPCRPGASLAARHGLRARASTDLRRCAGPRTLHPHPSCCLLPVGESTIRGP